jgi:hypothetical protein
MKWSGIKKRAYATATPVAAARAKDWTDYHPHLILCIIKKEKPSPPAPLYVCADGVEEEIIIILIDESSFVA